VQSLARDGGMFATWRDLCRYAFKKPALVEIAAYSTRYIYVRQTTDDTNAGKLDLVSSGFPSLVVKSLPLSAPDVGYLTIHSPDVCSAASPLRKAVATRYSAMLMPAQHAH